ncbi:MAG TPA: tRNA guanosine(34) transglycosylase Tgt [Acidimicrobiales bacterium]|nr:tRNA guanosine(34) transglycosylase Tgt [Acidimicrobiales bacterium]
MTRVVDIEIHAIDGDARAGTVTTRRGTFETPVFMPVGTKGAVKHLTSRDLEELGIEIQLANTYHLMLRPGADTVHELGGIHGFEDWHGHVLTDSGGYQVFSLNPKVDDGGATFTSTYDGSKHRLTPEDAVRIQGLIGADIQMVLDVCAPLPSDDRTLRTAVDRTAAWAARARNAPGRAAGQALFGIVQGGTNVHLRKESAARTVELDFDGNAIGGLSVGETRAEMLPALEATTELLPLDKPRYLMGVGDPAGMVEAVARGVDMFDCVLPTRLARHGTLLTNGGRVNLRNAQWTRSDEPPDPTCGCSTCARWSKGYLRHLLAVNEPTAARLTTVHNIAWLHGLVRGWRRAILAGTFEQERARVLAIWGGASEARASEP